MKKILKVLASGILLGLSVLILYLLYPNIPKESFDALLMILFFLDTFGICSILGIDIVDINY